MRRHLPLTLLSFLALALAGCSNESAPDGSADEPAGARPADPSAGGGSNDMTDEGADETAPGGVTLGSPTVAGGAEPSDGSGDPAVAPPAGAPPTATPRCDRNKPFGAPRLVNELVTAANETNARLSADEKTLFFTRGAPATQIMIATRANLGSPWSAAKALTSLSPTTSEQGGASITGDGRTMFFHSTRTPTSGGYDLWRSQLTGGGSWSAPERVTELDSGSDDLFPFVRADGRMILFASTRSGNDDLYSAYLEESGTFGAVHALSTLNTTAQETNPVITSDGLVMYFMRRAGDGDVFVTRRASVSSTWGTPVRVAELSTAGDDRPTWVSADECVIYVAIRPGANQDYDLYVAERGK